MKFMYPAVFRKNEDGTYNGYFPDLECCTSTGDTLDEAIENANEAAYNWITVELDENGKVDVAKAQPITFDPFNNTYVVLGKTVGRAFHDGMNLKK